MIGIVGVVALLFECEGMSELTLLAKREGMSRTLNIVPNTCFLVLLSDSASTKISM